MSARKIIGVSAGVGAITILVFLMLRAHAPSASLVAEIPRDSEVVSIDALEKNKPLPPPRIVFYEIFPNPEGSDVSKEFIILYNAGEYDVDVKGWTIQRLATETDTRTTLLKIGSRSTDTALIRANGRIVLGFNKNTNADITRSTALPNSAAIYFLVDADGEVRDQIFVPAMPEGEIFKR